MRVFASIICKLFGHKDHDDFVLDRTPALMWRCIRCGRREEMVFTCFIVRPKENS